MNGFDITEIDRRLANIVLIGVIEEVDYKSNPPSARLRTGELLTGFLPMAALRAGPDRDWHPFEIGEQVMTFCPSGEPANGVIICAINSDTHPRPQTRETVRSINFADGTELIYDRDARHMALNLQGGTLEVTATGGITINGDVQLNGRMSASDDVVADGISLIKHKHKDVRKGSDKTGEPV